MIADLYEAGFVDVDMDFETSFKFMLTQAGCRAAQHCWSVKDPKPFFAPTATLALEDASLYQLMRMVDDRGWKWEPWMGPKPATNCYTYLWHIYKEGRCY